MSRIKILTMLFITFLLGTGASVALYRYWIVAYHEQVLEPDLKQRLITVNAAIELFAYNRANNANQQVNHAAKLLSAFEEADAQKRRNRVHDELNVLHQVNADLKTASLVAGVDMKGQAFVRADDPNWSDDWSAIRPVTMAVKGSISHGFVTFKQQPFVFLAIPVIKQASADTSAASAPSNQDSESTPQPKKQPKSSAPNAQCPEGKRYVCWWPCLEKKKNKCVRHDKKKRCACLPDRSKKARKPAAVKKPPGYQPLPRIKQKSDHPKTSAPKPASEITNRAKQLGVIVLGYRLDDRLAQAIKSSSHLDMAFVSSQGAVHGATLHGRMRDTLASVLKSSISAGSKDNSFQLSFRIAGVVHLDQATPYATIRSPLPRIPSTDILLLQPLSPVYDLFQNYVLWLGVVGGLGFLLSLVLVFPGVSRSRRDIEAIEDKILETYNTGNLRVQFNSNAEGLIGSLATSLNKLYSQLRGERDEDDELKRSGDWNLEGLEVDERIVSGTFPVPQEVIEASIASEDSPSPAPDTQPKNILTPAPATEQETRPVVSAEASPPVPATQEPSSPDNSMEWIENLLANPGPHYEDVFVRYVAAKQELGEDTSRLDKERFIQKLHKNAQQCMEQYEDCRGVLFDITVKDHKVIIKPQLIPKE